MMNAFSTAFLRLLYGDVTLKIARLHETHAPKKKWGERNSYGAFVTRKLKALVEIISILKDIIRLVFFLKLYRFIFTKISQRKK
jgi:hypothetical protein